MFGKQYRAHKSNVIDIFNGYIEKRDIFNRCMKENGDGVDIKFLKSRIDSLKKEKFTLAVAGEVKAGKSTLINALIGEEILPSDVLQATSAVVEIFKSDTNLLKVKFGDGHEETIHGDPSTPDVCETIKRLQEICKINDEYRYIPTTIIDTHIIESDGNLVVNDDFIRQLEERSGLSLRGKQDVITRYIAERTPDKIPVEIEFGYPLKWEFDELRIVDTPGVNAIGGVQDVSFRFFEEANAILFVHQIKPVESESFKKFVSSVISNRSKETLFLILTHAANYPKGKETLHVEAKRLYKEIIPEERILVVDSLLKIIHGDLKRGIPIEEIEKDEEKSIFLSFYEKRAEKEGRELIDVVYESSGFQRMFDAIDEFSMKAPNLQLQEILEHIKKGYEEQEIQYKEKIKRLEKKKRNPQEHEEEINRIKKALEELKLLMSQTKENLKANYSGRHSSWQQDIDSLKVKYAELITGSDNRESTRKNTLDGLNAVQEKKDEFSKELTRKLRDILEEIGKDFSAEHQISIPKVDLEALEEEAKKEAYKEEDVYQERPFDVLDYITIGIARLFRENRVKIGTREVFDEEKFLGKYKTMCYEEFYKVVNVLANKSKEVLNSYLDCFEKEMESVINDRQRALEEEKRKKQSNAEIIAEIDALNEKIKAIQEERQRCEEVLEDLK